MVANTTIKKYICTDDATIINTDIHVLNEIFLFNS